MRWVCYCFWLLPCSSASVCRAHVERLPMERTWCGTRLARAQALCLARSGLIVKYQISEAADVQSCIAALGSLLKQGVRREALGGCLILLNRTYAKEATKVVVSLAQHFQSLNGNWTWTRRRLKRLAAQLRALARQRGPRYAKKVASRGALFTGSTWLQTLLRGGACNLKAFCVASRSLAKLFEMKECPDFADLCDDVEPVPCLAKYNGVNLVRMGCRAREVFRPRFSQVPFSERAWQKCRGMTRGSTSPGFDRLGVHSKEDASEMLYALKCSLGSLRSSGKRRSHVNRARLWDLPCFACEYHSFEVRV